MAAENSLTTLLRLTDAFLNGNGFQKTASQLQKEAKKRGIPLADEKPEASLPSLDSVFSHWQATQALNESDGSASDDEQSSVLSESDESSDESSDSDSEEDSEEEQIKPDTQRGTKRKRGKAAPSASASSGASSTSDSSDSDSSSSASSSSDSSSDSESDSDAESVKQAVVVTPKVSKAASSSSDSDSSSSDSDSDSSDSDSAEEPQETALTTPQAISRGNSTASTSTLSGTSVPDASSRKRKLSTDDEEAVQTPSASDSGPARKVKKTNEPFSRISKDQYVDPRLASNKFVPYDYAQRAHEKLIVTKGKGFTKEKNKGKRGSYRGGKIDFSVKGIKFDD